MDIIYAVVFWIGHVFLASVTDRCYKNSFHAIGRTAKLTSCHLLHECNWKGSWQKTGIASHLCNLLLPLLPERLSFMHQSETKLINTDACLAIKALTTLLPHGDDLYLHHTLGKKRRLECEKSSIKSFLTFLDMDFGLLSPVGYSGWFPVSLPDWKGPHMSSGPTPAQECYPCAMLSQPLPENL